MGAKAEVLGLNLWWVYIDLEAQTLTNTHIQDSLCMADVREGAVEGDPVTDVNVEAVLSVGLVDPVRVRQRERLALFTVTCIKHTHTGQWNKLTLYQYPWLLCPHPKHDSRWMLILLCVYSMFTVVSKLHKLIICYVIVVFPPPLVEAKQRDLWLYNGRQCCTSTITTISACVQKN